MWDLNAKFITTSTSSLMDDDDVIVDGSDDAAEDENDQVTNTPQKGLMKKIKKKRSSKIFGFSVAHDDTEDDVVVVAAEEEEAGEVMTREFFPLDETSSSAATDGFPRAHWVGVKFCQSEPPDVAAASESSHLQPLKKSRRGPRSRSSQYRGVTFYRRTGRWESHIWSLL
ncbi:hypothetical protein QQ045_020282 [Rhodiola kirilowii]